MSSSARTPPIQIGALLPERLGAAACSGAGETWAVSMGAGGVRLGWASGEGKLPGDRAAESNPGCVMRTAYGSAAPVAWKDALRPCDPVRGRRAAARGHPR